MTRQIGRETFGSRIGAVLAMIGVAAGLGNIWRFPYMVGEFGGAAFVLFYLAAVLLVGVPGLMAEWTLGRLTRRGPVGAFERGRLPLGRQLGWFFFVVMIAGLAYYTAVLGWVLFHALSYLGQGAGVNVDPAVVLPPEKGLVPGALLTGSLCTGLVIAGCALMLTKGVRRGIEAASRIILPALFAVLLVLIARAVTLDGAYEGLAWYILKFSPRDLTASAAVTALGQAVFSLSLGGTFMVVYGSYLRRETPLRADAVYTAVGDTLVGLLAGLAIFPAVFALGLRPNSGPGLLFETLPGVFDAMPLGSLFGLLFFGGLFGVAYLSAVAGFEVVVAGLTDNTRLGRRRAIWLMAGLVWILSLPPSMNMRVFLPWDLTFGSGMQTLGLLLSVLTVGWAIQRSRALRELSQAPDLGSTPANFREAGPPVDRITRLIYWWLRYVVPALVAAVGLWWLLTRVFGLLPEA